MNSQPLISIIVPVYKVEDYLDRCIQSIVSQTYPKLEIILVDDGSPDTSPQICDEWAKKDPRIIVIHKKNEGVTKARKTGVQKATGEYIGFVDSDDCIDEDMYEVLLNLILKYDADISHCGFQMEFPDGHINKFYGTDKIVIQNNFDGQKDLLEGKFIEPTLSNKLYKKSLFENLAYNEDIKINEDLMINFLLFQKSNKSVFYDVCKYHYMIRNNSASRAVLNDHKIYDPIIVKEFIRNHAGENIKDIADGAYLSTCINIYNSIILCKNKAFKTDQISIRNKIIGHSKLIHLLSKKQRILFILIKYFPYCYPFIYGLYVKHFQKDKYN